jgi:aspartyl protease family protein
MSRKAGIGMLAVAWLLLFGAASLAFNNWLQTQQNPNKKPRTDVSATGSQTVLLLANRQHHYLTIAQFNGIDVTLLVDTGATDVVLSAELAQQLGLPMGPSGYASTANGRIKIHHTEIEEIIIGGIVLRNVKASINPAMGPDQPVLLGMSALKNIELRQRDGELLLIQT